MPTRPTRLAAGGLLGLGALALTAGPAGAHVSPTEDEVPADAFTSVTLTVGHGCDGSPTTALAIQVPEPILNVTPQVHPGWDVAVETEALPEPAEGAHGGEVTERDAVVTYTAQAGHELLDGFRDSFTLGFQAPDSPGETLRFATIQTCTVGETAWIDEDPEAEAPAPAVLVGAAEEDGHGSDEDGEDDRSSDQLAIGGLGLGALGLATGGAALAKSRRA